ncbi:MAG: hypothetical protein OEV94_03510 [Deltaproteobacteria bacterium]|nr:hypothetical protein [Deltaproteobacteria bacterium]
MAELQGSPTLRTLRSRFLQEDATRLNRWLADEHPQISAFILNWVGDAGRLAGYLAGKDQEDQADVLFRVSRMDWDLTPTPFQEEIMVEALRQISPGLRKVEDAVEPEAGSPVRGLPLVLEAMERLEADRRETLLGELDLLDHLLARVARQTLAGRGPLAGAAPRSFFGLMNGYCDMLTHQFSVMGMESGMVYLESMETVSAVAWPESMNRDRMVFQVGMEDAQAIYVLASPRLFYHYLEFAFSSTKPLAYHSVMRGRVTFLEEQVAQDFVRTLAEYLLQVLYHQPPSEPPMVSSVAWERLEGDMKALDQAPVVITRLAFQFSGSMAGELEMAIPPTMMTALEKVHGPDLFREEPQAALELETPTADTKKQPPREETLEEMLWSTELEDADSAAIPEGKEHPMDFLLRGFAPQAFPALETDTEEGREWLADTHYYYGSRFLQRRMYPDAMESLDFALQLNPQHHFARLLLAAAWGETGQYMKEIMVYKDLAARGRCVPETQVLLARRLSYLKRVGEAFDTLMEAIKEGFQHLEIVNNDVCFHPLRNSVQWRQYLAGRS